MTDSLAVKKTKNKGKFNFDTIMHKNSENLTENTKEMGIYIHRKK